MQHALFYHRHDFYDRVVFPCAVMQLWTSAGLLAFLFLLTTGKREKKEKKRKGEKESMDSIVFLFCAFFFFIFSSVSLPPHDPFCSRPPLVPAPVL